jgi:hypothetical protein
LTTVPLTLETSRVKNALEKILFVERKMEVETAAKLEAAQSLHQQHRHTIA